MKVAVTKGEGGFTIKKYRALLLLTYLSKTDCGPLRLGYWSDLSMVLAFYKGILEKLRDRRHKDPTTPAANRSGQEIVPSSRRSSRQELRLYTSYGRS